MQTGMSAVPRPLDQGGPPVRLPEPAGGATAGLGEAKPVAALAAGKPADQAPAFDAEAMRKNLQAAIEHLNKQLASSGRNLGFTMDDVLNRPIVKVTNTQTGELVRQIPSDAVIKVAHTLEELKGLLYDATS